MAIKNYTTTISPFKTIGEITQCLVKHGAKKMITDFDDDVPVSLSFALLGQDGTLILFKLPCNWQGILLTFERDGVSRKLQTKEQAIKVGWRILKDWIESQMAIIDSQMVSPIEVFLPYAIMKNGNTFYNDVINNPQLFLNNGQNN
jgi:hypothetical protein